MILDEITKEALIEAIDNAETVEDIIEEFITAGRPQEEWIKTTPWSYGAGMGEVYGYYHKCSHCGKEFMYKSNFCPNCGCRMGRSRR